MEDARLLGEDVNCGWSENPLGGVLLCTHFQRGLGVSPNSPPRDKARRPLPTVSASSAESELNGHETASAFSVGLVTALDAKEFRVARMQT